MTAGKRKSLSNETNGPRKKHKGQPFARVAHNFVAIPFLEGTSENVHYVFAREQPTTEHEDWPVGRCLFLSSLPVGSSKDDAITALSNLANAEIEDVHFVDTGKHADVQRHSLLDTEGLQPAKSSKGPIPPLFQSGFPERDLATLRPAHSAVVIFTSEAALTAILKARPREPPSWPAPTLSDFAHLYQTMRPPLSAIKKHTDAWMAAFERREAIAAALPAPSVAEQINTGTADDGGGEWTLVKRGGTHGRSLLPTGAASVRDTRMATGLSSVHVASRSFEMGVKHGIIDEDLQKKLEKKRKKQEHIREGLYRFERDERRRKSLADMRSRFEADKAKVEERRKARKFNPY